MHRFAQLMPWLCFLSLTGPAALEAETPAAGVSGETPTGWERIQFVGNAAFTDEQLRHGLLGDPDFLSAAHPEGAATALGIETEALLVKGYRNAGFPDVTVETAREGRSLVCTIHEGPRFHCGEVRVHGAAQMDPEKLVERLGKPYPGADVYPRHLRKNGNAVIGWVDKDGESAELEDAVWDAGSPVRFDSEQSLQKHLRTALSDLGYSQTLAFTRIETDEETQSALLVIDLVDESEPDRAREIFCQGLKTHSPEQLMQFIGLTEGDFINREQIARIDRLLWESGRFSEHRLSYESATRRLTIDVKEAANVPPLDQPISEQARIFLAARRWLSRTDSRGQDIEYVHKVEKHVVRTIMSRHGMFLEISMDPTLAGEARPRLTLIVDERGMALNHSDHAGILHIDSSRVNGNVTLANRFRSAAEEDKTYSLNFRFNLRSNREEHQSPIEHVLEISPADWLPFAYHDRLETEIVGSEMVCRSKDHEMRIDCETGEIRRFNLGDDAEFRIEAGLFAAEQAKQKPQLASKVNHFEPQRPVTSIASYLLSPPVLALGDEMLADRTEQVDAVRKLVDSGVLTLVDAFVNETIHQDESERFVIPSDPPDAPSWQMALRVSAAKSILKLAPQCFTEDEWPFQITRETCLLIMGRGQHTGKVLQAMLANEDNGPLCHAIVAQLLAMIGQPSASRFANRALETLNAEDFSRDYRKLARLPGNGQILGTLLAFQSLSEAELDAILEYCKSEPLRRFIQIVHATPIGESEEPGLIWYQISEAGLRSSMEKIR